METFKKLWPAAPVAGAAVLAGRIFRAAHRPDLPSLPNQNPSGTFGDESLPQLRIVAMGDSSITSPGIDDLDDTWIRQAALYLADRYRVTLHSVAVGGARARDVLDGQLDRAIALRPHIAVVSVGANDALRTPLLARFERQLHDIVAALHRVAGAVVLQGVGDLGKIPRLPGSLRWLLTWRARDVDRRVGRVARTYPRASRIEVAGQLAKDFRAAGEEIWAEDLFHLSAYGHSLFREEMMPAFDAALRHLNGSGPSKEA